MLMLRADETLEDYLADDPSLLADVAKRGFSALLQAADFDASRRERASIVFADALGPAIVALIWPSLETETRAIVESAIGRHLVVRPFSEGLGVHLEVLSEQGLEIVDGLSSASLSEVRGLGFELRGKTTTTTAMTVATATVARLAAKDSLRSLRRLDLWGLGAPAPEFFSHLARLPLETLRVVGPFGAAGVRAASALNQLTTLTVEGDIGDEGAAILGTMRGLRRLRLARAITASSIKHLSKLGLLESLQLPDLDLPKGAVSTLAVFSALTALDVSGSPRLDGDALAKLVGAKAFTDLRFDNMRTLGRATIDSLSNAAQLTKLSLRGVAIGDDGLSRIARAPALKQLDVSGCGLTAASHAALRSFAAATEMTLDDNPIGSAIAGLGSLEKLRTVQASRCGIDAAALAGLTEARALRRLRIAHNPLGSSATGHLALLRDLRQLDVEACRLGDASALGDLSALSYLNASSNGASSAMAQACARLPRLRWVLAWNNPFGSAGGRNLAGLKVPFYVNVKSCLLDDEAVAGWCDWPTLRQLIVADNPLGDGCVAPFGTLRHLWHLNIAATKVSYEGAKQLSATLPNCELFV